MTAGHEMLDSGMAGVPLAIRAVLAAWSGQYSVPACLVGRRPETRRSVRSTFLSAIAA
jgi:hypothetical protein